jgi:ketosteroid isomerase-like protein
VHWRAAPTGTPVIANDLQLVAVQETHIRDARLGNDADALDKVLAEGYVSTSASGEIRDREQVLAALRSGESGLYKIDYSEMQVRCFGPTVCVVTGREDLGGKNKSGDFSSAYRFTRVWHKEDGEWRAVAEQYTSVVGH